MSEKKPIIFPMSNDTGKIEKKLIKLGIRSLGEFHLDSKPVKMIMALYYTLPKKLKIEYNKEELNKLINLGWRIEDLNVTLIKQFPDAIIFKSRTPSGLFFLFTIELPDFSQFKRKEWNKFQNEFQKALANS